MKSLGQLLVGLLSAFATLVVVVSALMLSITEGQMAVAEVQPSPTQTGPTLTLAPGVTPPTPQPASPTAALSEPTLCRTPDGWMPYTVEAGDSLALLAEQSGSSVEQITQANCLFSASLLPGTILYLPYTPPSATPQPTVPPALPTLAPTASVASCGPPRGWVRYTVQPNDNLFRLSLAFGVSVNQLQFANCLSGTLIQTGTRLYVPNVPTRTPEVTDTEPPPPSVTPAPPTATTAPTTAAPATVTVAPTDSPTPTNSATSPPPSETPTATGPTPTPTPSETQTVPAAGESGTSVPPTSSTP